VSGQSRARQPEETSERRETRAGRARPGARLYARAGFKEAMTSSNVKPFPTVAETGLSALGGCHWRGRRELLHN
jgi:hypothetical protein